MPEDNGAQEFYALTRLKESSAAAAIVHAVEEAAYSTGIATRNPANTEMAT